MERTTRFDFFSPDSSSKFKWIGVIVIIVLIVILVFLFTAKKVAKVTEEKAESTEENDPTKKKNATLTMPDYTGINDTNSSFYSPIKDPGPINDIVLSNEEMNSATLINFEKSIINHLHNKIVKFEMAVTNANFRLYGSLSPRGHIYFFNHVGKCVVDITFDNATITSNVSGVVKTVTLRQLAKSLHFVMISYVLYCNGLQLGELHGQHDVQYIRVDDQDVKEIQLIDLDSQSALLNVGDNTIFGN